MIVFKGLGKLGRLGNQLHQIASTIGQAEHNQTGFGFPKWEYQEYFKHPLPEIPNLEYYDYSYFLTTYREINVSNTANVNLVGYFQSYKYWWDHRNTIFRYLETNIEVSEEFTDCIAIHVRRGDYLNLQHIHPVLPISYYKRAMSYFTNQTFMVFSDDIQWCQNNFPGSNYIFVAPNENPLVDLIFMSKCKGHIIANSSFSWWSAMLSKNTDKIVSPRVWALNESEDSHIDRIPDWWEKIDYVRS